MASDKKLFEIENPKGLADPRENGYSHMATVPAGNTLVFISGQGGFESDGNLSKDFRTQVVNAFKNLSIALESKGLTLQHIFKVIMLVVDFTPDKHKIIIAEAKKIWPDENYPTNTLIPVALLALEGMQIEIDATALLANYISSQ